MIEKDSYMEQVPKSITLSLSKIFVNVVETYYLRRKRYISS